MSCNIKEKLIKRKQPKEIAKKMRGRLTSSNLKAVKYKEDVNLFGSEVTVRKSLIELTSCY